MPVPKGAFLFLPALNGKPGRTEKASGNRRGRAEALCVKSPEKAGFPGFEADWKGLFPARDGRAGTLTNVPAPTYNIFNSEHC